MQRYVNPVSTKTICAAASEASRNAALPASAEHGRSTLQEPAVPISWPRLVKREEGVVKMCEAAPMAGAIPEGSRLPGTKNSTVCVSPSVSGDHQGVVRSAMSPT